MKKAKLITIVLAVISSTAVAQFNQGRLLAGGSISFQSTTTNLTINNNTSTTSTFTLLSFTPQVGFFVVDRFAVGAGLTIQSFSTKLSGSGGTFGTSTVIFSPFTRYYLGQKFFFQGSVGFGTSSSDQGSNSTSTTNRLFNWTLGGGYVHFLNDFVALEPLVGYQFASLTDTANDIKSKTSGLFIQFGIQVYLGNRSE